jgi:hypothetical protein
MKLDLASPPYLLPGLLQCVYSKWGHLENTNQSHCRTKIEKINKRLISQSALGQKQFEQINECQTVKIDLNLSFDWTSFSLIRFFFLICKAIG